MPLGPRAAAGIMTEPNADWREKDPTFDEENINLIEEHRDREWKLIREKWV